MARLKSEEKRQAILDAACGAIAERGLAAPTSAIAKAAGVAEGSIFTYFADKDALLNALYLSIKSELQVAMADGYPSRASFAERFAHVWDRYITWGAARSAQRRAMAQLAVSDKITAASRAEGEAMFGDIGQLFSAGDGTGAWCKQPDGFCAGIIIAVAETTLAFMHRDPAQSDMYRKGGFDMLWRALAAE